MRKVLAHHRAPRRHPQGPSSKLADAVESASPYGSAGERKIRAKSVPEMYFRAGDYRQAAHYGKSYLDAYADDATVAALVADSELRLKQ